MDRPVQREDRSHRRPEGPARRLRDGQRRTMEQRSGELPDKAWREITVAQGSQGPRSYMFSAQRVRVTRKGKPGQEAWAVYRRNLDGSEPRYYLSNAAEDTPLETLAYVGGSRWPIETEFETEKGDVGLDEYETRSWSGWHHHIASGGTRWPANGRTAFATDRTGRQCCGWSPSSRLQPRWRGCPGAAASSRRWTKRAGPRRSAGPRWTKWRGHRSRECRRAGRPRTRPVRSRWA